MVDKSMFAKLAPPRLGTIFPRERLYTLLDKEFIHPIVWLAGVPGAGKSTIVSAYINERILSSLWYQLDDGDSDPATFFHYLDVAVEKLINKSDALPKLTADHLPSLVAFGRTYFERLGALCTKPVLLVFDNYQDVAPDSQLHNLLAQSLTKLPPHVHVLFISHTEPPSAYARLRVHQTISLIGGDILQFTDEESIGLARQLSYEHSPEVVANICQRMNGWAAGLVLSMQHMQDAMSPPPCSAEDVLFDYLAAETMHRMDLHEQHLLVQLAFLPEINTSIAQLLKDDDSVALLLETLARRNFFTQKHGGPEVRFQFHPLFKRFLQAWARKILPEEELSPFLLRAAQILLKCDRIEDAIELLRIAGNGPELAQLIVKHAPIVAQQGRLQTLLAWISSVPKGLLEKSPWLLCWLGISTLMIRPIEARQYLQSAYQLFQQAKNHNGQYLAWTGIVDSFTLAWKDFVALDPWVLEFTKLYARNPLISDPSIAGRVVFAMMAVIMHRQPDHPDVDYWRNRAEEMVVTGVYAGQRALIGSYLVIYLIWRGEMRTAAYLVETIDPVVRNSDMAPLVRLLWHIARSMYAWATLDSRHAFIEVRAALQLAEKSSVHAFDYRVCMHGIYASFTEGNLDSARQYQIELEEAMQRSGRADPSAFHHMHSLLHLHQGNFCAAVPHSRQAILYAIETGNMFHQALAHLCAGHVFYACDAEKDAEYETECAAEIAERAHLLTIMYFCDLNRALIALKRHATITALEFLTRALELDRIMGGVSNPYFLRQSLVRLYCFALEHDIEVAHVQTMIHRHALVPEAQPLNIKNWPYSVKIFALGDFRILVDDKQIQFNGKSQKRPLELLKALISFGPRKVNVEKLLDALWPDSEGDAAYNNLKTTTNRLRNLLGNKDTIVISDGKLYLDTRYCWVDSFEFQHIIDNNANNDIEVLKAQTLYKGELLANEIETPWILCEREKLRSKYNKTYYMRKACFNFHGG